MLIDVRGTGLSGADFVPQLYRAEGVSVLDGSVFGEETRGFVRASFAVEEAMLHEAAAADPALLRHFEEGPLGAAERSRLGYDAGPFRSGRQAAYGSVAQSVEQRPFKALVVGSSPTRPTT